MLGRKAFLFADTPAGAKGTGQPVFIGATAQANDLEPWAYLKQVFTELPQATTLAQIEALLPWQGRARSV